MKLSIIIPTLNEEEYVVRLIKRIQLAPKGNYEIIVADGGSTDNTLKLVDDLDVSVVKTDPSRAIQMNEGAKIAKHDFLFFVHADTLPPKDYYQDLIKVKEKGDVAACYRSKYETTITMLKLNSFFTRFYWLVARGGDQSLFISKEKFWDVGGYDETMEIMEEYPLIEKLMKQKEFYIIPKPILISTRKYRGCKWRLVSKANYTAFTMFKKGASTKDIKEKYLEILG